MQITDKIRGTLTAEVDLRFHLTPYVYIYM